MGTRQRFSKEFKLEAVRLLPLGQKPAAQLALELGVRRNQLYKWKEQLAGKGETAFRAAAEVNGVSVGLRRASRATARTAGGIGKKGWLGD